MLYFHEIVKRVEKKYFVQNVEVTDLEICHQNFLTLEYIVPGQISTIG